MSQRVLEQFFDVAVSLGLSDQVRLEDTPVVSRTSLLDSPGSAANSPQPSPQPCTNSSPLVSQSSSSLQNEKAADSLEDASGSRSLPPSSSSASAPSSVLHQDPSKSASPNQPEELLQQSLSIDTAVSICPHCLKRFKANNIHRHLRTHDQKVSKKCNMCGKALGRGDNLKRHQQKWCRR